ncbi:MAG: DUF4810 domain-containing protein [Prevotellaceae bacterium]|jgi:hypothetical protein|nr:DUF4810 domain-containing protein [Prevotellaceae bacterium]
MKKLLLIAACSLLLVGCASKTALYSWSKYQEVSYSYIKTSTDEALEKLLKEYQYIIDHQKSGRQTVPPGIYADYGYLLVKHGKVKEGIALMKMEVALYPESAQFIEGIIKRLEE